MLTSIIIPMYNERPFIVDVVDRCAALPIDKEIIVVDNGSTDGSCEAVMSHVEAECLRGVHVVLCPDRGKAMAVKCGIARSRGDVVVLQDADGEYDPQYIPLIVQHLADHDAVHGVRVTRPYVLGLGQFVANKLLLGLICRRFDARLTDIFTGQRGLRRSLLSSMEITSRGFDLETELTLCALAAGSRIAEIEVTYRPRTRAEGKKIGLTDFVSILWKFEVLSARLMKKTGGRRLTPAVTCIPPERHVFTYTPYSGI